MQRIMVRRLQVTKIAEICENVRKIAKFFLTNFQLYTKEQGTKCDGRAKLAGVQLVHYKNGSMYAMYALENVTYTLKHYDDYAKQVSPT